MSTSNSITIEKLRDEFGDLLRTDVKSRNDHAKDVCHHPACPPDAVIYPQSNEDVVKIVRICHHQHTPMVPFGTGTGVEGGVVAVHGGIAIDLTEMKDILRVSVADADATVQAGVTRYRLNKHLESMESGLFFPVDPGADASLGGMVATAASGSSAVGYGTMRENVLGLTAVLADGTLIETGSRARKSSAGYDLTHLLIGSEGTLAIVTEVTLRLSPQPAAASAAVCGFAELASAVDATIEILGEGLAPARIELLDEILVQAINAYSQTDFSEVSTLLFEYHGDSAQVARAAARTGEVVQKHGAADFRWASEEDQRRQLWQTRYDAYYACQAMRPGSLGFVTDVCVPLSRLAECIQRSKQLLVGCPLPSPLFGHVGDGNFHIVFMVEPGNRVELELVEKINSRVVDLALEMGGTCSGEHGIGLGKINALDRQYGPGVSVMRSIKRALDPENLLNPGKILDF